MKRHDLIQGSDEWKAHRLNHFNASEAAAMLGLDKHMSRGELLALKATGIEKEVSSFTQAIFDEGHRVEALARPIVEGIAGEKLPPAVGTEGRLSASFDGLNGIVFEHKQWNNTLAEKVTFDEVPDSHMPQLQQQLMISGAKKAIFVVSDGTAEKMVHCDVFPDKAWFKRLKEGWKQFAIDLEAYQHQEEAIEAVPAHQEALPAVVVRVSGEIAVACNLPAFGAALRVYIDKINLNPQDDQDFADLNAAAKALKKAEDALKTAEKEAIAQASSLNDLLNIINDHYNTARSTRLIAEKIVKVEKENRRNTIHAEAIESVRKHYAAISANMVAANGPQLTMPQTVDGTIAEAMKGRQSIKGWKEAAAQAVADAKIEANSQAEAIRASLAVLNGIAESHRHLFPDRLALAMEPATHVEATIKGRIADWKEQESELLESERTKIRAEEEEKRGAGQLIGFDAWWSRVGSGLRPLEGLDHEEHAQRIARAAWAACESGEYK